MVGTISVAVAVESSAVLLLVPRTTTVEIAAEAMGVALAPAQAKAIQVRREAAAARVVRPEAVASPVAMLEVVEGRQVGQQERVPRASRRVVPGVPARVRRVPSAATRRS